MPSKILVVDDEPQFERLILQRFRRQLREGIFEFVFALDGEEALERLNEHADVEMVLTDINMPKMDGLTLLGKLKELRPLLKTVIVSAYGDMENIRTAMNRGAFDFVTKPIEFSDLEKTIQKTLEETRILKEVEQARDLVERHEALKELDQLKTQFFTNISHEFRTPLTVISGMSEQIEEQPDRWLQKGIRMIQRNTQQLLNLVNQILDLRKLESKALSLNLNQSDIVPYLEQVIESFRSLAEFRDIQLHLLINMTELNMDFDREKLLRILSNLLSNAVKFSKEGDHIYFQADQISDQLIIRIKDTGMGISEEQLPYIFDRFFRADAQDLSKEEGTGIGLALVKELVQLMEGKIEVQSQVGKGTTFILTLPVRQEAPPAKLIVEMSKNPILTKEQPLIIKAEDIEAELPRLLIVEDNPDIAQYLFSCLEGLYHLDWAQDGEQGIEKALEHIPDIILSDVMMPKKSGLELCQSLKTETKTSHIPIILLTAKADIESKISGLERGADAYIAKPFEKREVLIRLEKLLESRKQLQERYKKGDPVLVDNAIKEGTQEDEFILQLKDEILLNIENEDYGILKLCRSIGMSRTQLHRKIKALTGRSTSSFVRSIRLNKAKEILTSSDLNISQVAFEVGFKDPKYFSRTFTEEFGKSPNQLRK